MGLCIIYDHFDGFMHPYAHFFEFLYNFAKYTFSKVGKMDLSKNTIFLWYNDFTERAIPLSEYYFIVVNYHKEENIMANFTMEQIKELKELGFSNEQIVTMVSGTPKASGTKKATESKAPKKVLTAEEREAKAKARTEAWKAEKKAWAEEHYTEEERKAFKEERDARRAEGKKKHLAYCQTNAFFKGKKVSKEEWHKKYNEYLKKAN